MVPLATVEKTMVNMGSFQTKPVISLVMETRLRNVVEQRLIMFSSTGLVLSLIHI